MIARTRDSLLAFLRRSFLAGLLVVLPSALSLWLCWKIFDWIDRSLGWTLKGLPIEPVRGTGFVVGALLVIAVGALAQNLIGRRIVDVYHGVIERLPIVNQLQGAVRKVMEILLSEEQQSFRKVVLIEYPREGCFAIGFLSAEVPRFMADLTAYPRLFSVFVPTTPNPTSGFLLMLPEDQIQVLDIPPEDGLKLVISGGLLVPSEAGPLRGVEGEPLPASAASA